MRSLLFVPADGGPKLDKALASGADARDPRSGGFDCARAQGRGARRRRWNFSKARSGKKDRPRLLVRINGLDTGMTDADLDAIVAGKPDAMLFPKAEGGATVTHLDAKLTAREAIAGIARRRDQDSGADGGVGRRPVHRRHLRELQRAADRHDLGAGGSVGRARRRSQPRSRRHAHRALSHRARHVPVRRGGGEGAGDRNHPRRFPQRGGPAPRYRDRAPRRLHRAARHPSGAGGGDQRGVHAEREQIEKAKAIVAAFAAKPGAGAVGIDGKMYDRPHLKRAQALLARIGA